MSNPMLRLAICGVGLGFSGLGYLILGYCLGGIPLWSKILVVSFAIAFAGILSGLSPLTINYPLSWTWGLVIYFSWFALFGFLLLTTYAIQQETSAGLLLVSGGLMGTIAWAAIARQLFSFLTPVQGFLFFVATATIAIIIGYILFLKHQVSGVS